MITNVNILKYLEPEDWISVKRVSKKHYKYLSNTKNIAKLASFFFTGVNHISSIDMLVDYYDKKYITERTINHHSVHKCMRRIGKYGRIDLFITYESYDFFLCSEDTLWDSVVIAAMNNHIVYVKYVLEYITSRRYYFCIYDILEWLVKYRHIQYCKKLITDLSRNRLINTTHVLHNLCNISLYNNNTTLAVWCLDILT